MLLIANTVLNNVGDISMRDSMSKYEGHIVYIRGRVSGRPIYHELTHIKYDEKIQDYPKVKRNILIL